MIIHRSAGWVFRFGFPEMTDWYYKNKYCFKKQ